jgi:hypothetical protein
MAVTWSFDHSAIYRSLYLRLAITNDLSLAVEPQGYIRKYHKAARVSIQLLELNAHSRIINKVEEE